MALRAFLTALKCPQHEAVLLGAGFDDVDAFAAFSNDDMENMALTLRSAGIPIGHVERIMITMRACQDKELVALGHAGGSSPLKFDYNKEMPLLKTRTQEVAALNEELQSLRSSVSAKELIMQEERDKLLSEVKEWRRAQRKQNGALLAANNQLDAETRKKDEAQQEAAAAKQEAAAAKQEAAAAREAALREVAHAQEAAKEVAEAECKLRLDEMRELLSRARTAETTAEARAEAAEKTAAHSTARAVAAEEAAAEELVVPYCPHCGKRTASPPPRVYSNLVSESRTGTGAGSGTGGEPSSVC